MVTPTNHVITWAKFSSRKVPGTLEVFATSFCQKQVKNKKSLTISARGPWHCVLYRKSDPGYGIMFLKSLDEGLSQQLLG